MVPKGYQPNLCYNRPQKVIGFGDRPQEVIGFGDLWGPSGTKIDQKIVSYINPQQHAKTNFSEMAQKTTFQKWVLHNLTYTEDTHRL